MNISTAKAPTNTEPGASNAVDPVPSNFVVLRGTVTSDPVERDLPAGGVVVQFDVTTVDHLGGRTVKLSVPVAWSDPADAASIRIDSEVLVIGTVRRRFFRVGGATQSRTEVVVETVIPARRRKQVAMALASIAAQFA